MIRITLLGTGTPVIDPLRQHSSLLVDVDGQKLLFDAGRGVTTQLLQVGTPPQAVDALFITHHHYDHIGNLGEFLLTAWHNGRATPLPIYGPPGTAAIVTALLMQVYASDIEFAHMATHIIAAAGAVGQIAVRNDVKQLVLTHIRPKSPDLIQSMIEDVRRSYQGVICVSTDLLVIDI